MCVCVCVCVFYFLVHTRKVTGVQCCFGPPPDIHCIEKHTSLWFEKERKPHTFVSFIYVG